MTQPLCFNLCEFLRDKTIVTENQSNQPTFSELGLKKGMTESGTREHFGL